MKIALASDHGGFAMKEIILEQLQKLGHQVKDFGCPDEKSVDYSDYAIPVAEAVARGEFERGILVCGTGVGMSFAANKVKGIRCALCTDQLMAKLTREHNDSNVLALGGRIIGPEMAKAIVAVWVSTPFSGEARHARRIEKVSEYENK